MSVINLLFFVISKLFYDIDIGQVVAFDMRRFFAHKDQTAVVMYILDCLRRIQL